MTKPLWPRSTTSTTCFTDGWEVLIAVDGADTEDFVTDYFSTDLEDTKDRFYKLCLVVTTANVVKLERYDGDLDDYVVVAATSTPAGGGILRLQGFIPRDTVHRLVISGAEPTVTYADSFASIMRSKT